METIHAKFAALLASCRYIAPENQENITKIADKIGPMDRDTYLAFLSLWKASYKALTTEIRLLRSKRKGGTPEAEKAISDAAAKTTDARAMMLLRHALKDLARRHAREKTAEAV